MTPLLQARGLEKRFHTRAGTVHAVNGVDLSVAAGETLALIGESGCGKTTLGRILIGLHAPNRGMILFKGRNAATLRRPERRAQRAAMQMIFQDPYASLDPRLTAGAIIEEPLIIHRRGTKAERRARIADLMTAVGLAPDQASQFPHAFSGGQRQRIGIARALALDPELIIADEPVSALDVSIQSQILNLLQDLRETRGIALLFITHDLAVVDAIADRVAVMYFGRIVEMADRAALLESPRHPYTRALRDAVPTIGVARRRHDALKGEPPSPLAPPPGCPFHPRCPRAEARCEIELPPLAPLAGAPDHVVACHFPDKGHFADENHFADESMPT